MINKNKEIQKFVANIINDPVRRREIVKRSHLYFFCTYFPGYVTYEMAPFHHEFFTITENDDISLAVITAFRESSKSTIMTLSNVLWSILGTPQKKYVLIVSQTQELAKQHFGNLKRALETNALLKADLGPFEQDLTWNTGALIIPRYNAKVLAVSTEQSIRGTRFDEHRPDLVICDDLDDSASVRTKESRDKTYNWFNSEIVPIGSKNTKIIVIGNLLHKDSLIKRLEAEIDSKERSGIFRAYPVIDDNNKILWPGKYPTLKDIEAERQRIGNKFTWSREFLQKVIDDSEPVIEGDWIQYYHELPTILRNQGFAFAGGVDLAVSERKKADYTAIVTCKIIGSGDKRKIFILPNPINTQVTLPVTLDNIRTLVKSFGENVSYTFYIEEAGTQKGLTQLLVDKHIRAVGVSIGQNDKRTRLSIISEYIRSGKVLFPDKGAEDLIRQILDFGVENNDDLVDALTTLIIGIMTEPPLTCNITRQDALDIGKALNRRIYGQGNSGSRGMGSGVTSSIEFTDSGVVRRY